MTTRTIDEIIGTPTNYTPTAEGVHVLTTASIANLAELSIDEAEKILDAIVDGYPAEGQGPIVRIELEHGMPRVVREFLGMTAEEYERFTKLRANR